MKILKIGLLGLLVTVSAGLLVTAVSAQAGLTATPDQLTITTVRGQELITRTLLLRSSQTITNVQFIPLDLTRDDDGVVLPADKIRPTQVISQLTASEPFTIPLVFDLRDAPSGEFKGEFLVTHSGGTLSVPLTVRLRDSWPGPLAMLVVGVVLGGAVSVYRSRGKPRDEVLVRMGQVRTEAQADRELASSFRSQINAHLLEAESALQARNWSDAQGAVQRAEAIWLKWRQDRTDWLEQLAYADELMSSDKLEADSRYLKTVARRIQDALRDAPGLPNGPREFNQVLNTLANQLDQYFQLRAEIEDINTLGEISVVQRNTLAGFTKRLDAMTPGDADQYKTLQAEVAATREKIIEQLPAESQDDATRSITVASSDLAPPIPSLSPLEKGITADKADLIAVTAGMRLQLFKWGSYLVAIILLAGAGFSELYLARPTFGHNPSSDYFALLIWGFGAEASRAAITDVLRALDLPSLR